MATSPKERQHLAEQRDAVVAGHPAVQLGLLATLVDAGSDLAEKAVRSSFHVGREVQKEVALRVCGAIAPYAWAG